MKLYKKLQHGAVSIFIVIFAALLILVITIAFVGIMLKDQEQATSADLSQSAYDSAQAGVEDAKRALIQYQTICESEGDCLSAKAIIESDNCNDSISKLEDISIESGEVEIKTGDSDNLNQAYTCVKVDIDTVDYLGTLDTDGFEMISLVGVSDFNRVKIEWFSSKNLNTDNDFSINLTNQLGGTQPFPLYNTDNWPENRPPIMQIRLIQHGSSFNLDDFDDVNSSNESNSNTVFLYPVSNLTLSEYSFVTQDGRQTSSIKPTPVRCRASLASGGYSCSTTLVLPSPIGGGNKTAYLNLNSIYNRTDFKVSLYKGAELVKFGGVQPEIDSTGRANDLFRRVKVRVKLTDADFPHPVSAVYVSDGLCKNFIVTNDAGDYHDNCR